MRPIPNCTSPRATIHGSAACGTWNILAGVEDEVDDGDADEPHDQGDADNRDWMHSLHPGASGHGAAAEAGG